MHESWQPIATIPDDGRWVLVAGQFIAIRRHSFANEPGKLFDQKGKECTKRWTHWQPLPPMPNN